MPCGATILVRRYGDRERFRGHVRSYRMYGDGPAVAGGGMMG